MYLVPNIFLVGYGRTQTYQVKCLKCGVLFFQGRKVEVFCEICSSIKDKEELQKYIKETNYSDTPCVGNVIGWEQKTSHSEKRSRKNYNKAYNRDGYTCQYCGYNPRKSKEFLPLHIDHLKPIAFGGSFKLDNLVVSCSQCNNIASSKLFNTFEEKKHYILQRRIEKGLYVNSTLIIEYGLNK